MEFDNDRKRTRGPRAVSTFWLPLLLFSPLVNSVTVFPTDPRMWIILFNLSLAYWPLYYLYARVAIWDRRPVWLYGAITLGAFVLLHAITLGVYALLALCPLHDIERAYFTYSTPTFARECVWIALNLFIATVTTLALRVDEEKTTVSQAQQESIFFKLRYLRSQLNPHFLFNTLNSIYSLSLQKSDKAPEVVVRLADLMRYLIYECNEEKIPLDKEIEFIRNYIEIEKIRHQADIRFTVEGKTEGLMIEPFLFISFIENGFKHAMDHTFNEPFIYITLRVGNGQLTLNVINSTNADLEMQAKRINGMGLSHSRSLLELLYPASYDLDIIQTEKDETRTSELRLRNARERLENLYPDAHTLDVILNKSTFTVSLIVKTVAAC